MCAIVQSAAARSGQPAGHHDASSTQLIVVANRLPVRRVDSGFWQTSPGGLVSALLPILQRRQSGDEAGAWVGWAGSPDERLDPFMHDGISNVPVTLSKDDLAGYYDGMSNSTLWPLYHDAVRTPTFRRSWYRTYEQVNEAFADAAARIASPNAMVWVHDYHLHLVPAMLRARRPDLRIGFFLHIPFPGRGLFAQLPWRSQLIRGTLGADVVGFQTATGASNFVELACRYTSASDIDGGVEIDGREVCVDAFPISIDAKAFDAKARHPGVVSKAQEYRNRLGGRKILLGVDRMDYTKGIDIRLRAFQELLRSGRVSADDVVLIQSAVPTRESVDEYAELRASIEEKVGQINGEFGRVGRAAVEYLRQNVPMDELVALYLAADVMLVTPLRDGMNLIAKEYIAAHTEERGVLVLSEFTGAAGELTEAVIVNPHDLDGLAAAMEEAIKMDGREARRRQQALREKVFANDVYRWAELFMQRLAA